MRTVENRPGRRTSGALAGANKAAGIGLGAPQGVRPSGRRPRPHREAARGIRQRSPHDRLPRQNNARRPHRVRDDYNRPPRHRSGRRSGGCLSTIAALIIMLVIVFLVFFKEEIKEKVLTNDDVSTSAEVELSFKNETLLNDHYEKHGKEMGYTSAASYLDAANAVVNNPKSLHKLEAEDGDDVYYLESTNEFVIVSKDGFIRTYFSPEDGIEYYNRQ